MTPILFPGFNLSFNISPVAFSFLGRNIYWYGIIISIGVIIALLFCKKDDGKYGISWDMVLDYLLIAFIPSIVGARIYYVVFNWEYYREHIDEIFAIWNGGIAIYGAVLTALIIAFLYCKKKKICFLSFCDYCVPYLAIAQSIGRWGNFVNQEAFGYETNLPWKMGLFSENLGEYIFVHPTFIYEALGTFVIFVFLYLYRNKRKWDGQIFYLYMIAYGVVRFFVEGFRTDSLYLGSFRVSQVLALFFVVVCSVLYFKKNRKSKN